MFEEDEEDPRADGKQFDAVSRYEEPTEPGPGDLGPPIPKAPDTTPAARNVDPKVRILFWRVVLLFNVAILAVAVGVMLVLFGTDRVLGIQILAGGLLLSAYGYYRYRNAKAEVAALVGDDGPEDNG